MKILGHRHTGIIVSDFEKMLAFYSGMGLELKRRDIEKGPFIDGLLGAKNIVIETAKLVLENENLPVNLKFQLELMKVINSGNSETENKTKSLKRFNFLQQSTGVLDIAFTVDDVKAVIEYIISKGGDVIGEPLQSVAGFPALHCYARDPEGNVIHLAQNLQ